MHIAKYIRTNILITLVFLTTHLYAQNFQSVKNLIERNFPVLKDKVKIEKIRITTKDTASYFCKKNQLVIHSSSVNAANYALYDYVKKYCHSSLSHTGNNIQIPKLLPPTTKIETISAVLPLRYALNYCTYNYTMSFWNWAQWEKELDWMALNGVNLMLAPIGTEAVWQSTLKQLGVSDKDIKAFIPGPAFNAWWLMANLEGWGGPVSDAMINHWERLQKKILSRMNELNIQPVIQSFTGVVPSSLTKYFPKAEIVNQGSWCGFQRPSVLLAKDPLFNKIAKLYYQNFKERYGSLFKYLGGDLFHEGGKTAGIHLEEEGRLVQVNMQQYFPDAVWVLQGWQDNPKENMMKGLNKKNTLIIDLLGDRTETWLNRNQYGGFNWIWSTIGNFGGRTTTGATLLRVFTEPNKAKRLFNQKSTLQGVGIIPEGIKNNAILYQWALDAAWQKETPNIEAKLNQFLIARYGSYNADATKAWQYLLQTVYNGREPSIQGGQGGYESIFCARPSKEAINSTSSWGPTHLWFDPELLTQAALALSKAAKQFKNVPSFQYDLVDTWRQVINLKARNVYEQLRQALIDKNKEAFERSKQVFIQLLLLQNKWLGTNEQFRIGKWLEEAKQMLPNPVDKKLCEWNARTQITYWGPDETNTPLHEYAYKEWQGILKDLYLKQWEAYFNYIEAELNGNSITWPSFFEIEKHWSETQNIYTPEAEGNSIEMLPQLIKLVSTPMSNTAQNEIDFFNDK